MGRLATNATYFFVGLAIFQDDRVAEILTYIIPFLSNVHMRICGQQQNTNKLTNREVEVLKWIKDGKSSWEISMILKCSKRTIDFHMQNIKKKLNAVNRAHAVAIGLEKHYIDF